MVTTSENMLFKASGTIQMSGVDKEQKDGECLKFWH